MLRPGLRPILIFALVACGRMSTLEEIVDAESPADAAAPLCPRFTFVDVDLTRARMAGVVRIQKSPDDTPAMAYEVVVAGGAEPLVTLAATGSDLTWELPWGTPGAPQLGVRSLLRGRRSDTTWVEGDNYVHVEAISPSIRAATFDDQGRRYFADDHLLTRCNSIGGGCDYFTPVMPKPFALVFEPVERRLVGAWREGSVVRVGSVTLDGNDPRISQELWMPAVDASRIALDGKGHVFVGGTGFRCELSTMVCTPWQTLQQGSWQRFVVDPKLDRMWAFRDQGAVVLECSADGTGCAPWAKGGWVDHYPFPYVPEHSLIVDGIPFPAGGMTVCDLTLRGCAVRPFSGGDGSATWGAAWDPAHERLWALLARDLTTYGIARVALSGQVDTSVAVAVSDSSPRGIATFVDPVDGRVHIVTSGANFYFRSF